MAGVRDIGTILWSAMTKIPSSLGPDAVEHNKIVQNSESPIEAMMMMGFMGQNIHIIETKTPTLDDVYKAAIEKSPQIVLGQQVIVAFYRLDFLLVCAVRSEEPIAIAVECDGREFHHSSTDQIVRDNKRMRDLAKLRIYTARFLGAEIFYHARDCVAEVMNMFPSEGAS